MRFVGWTLVVVLCALGALYATLPWWVGWLLERELAPYGLSVRAVDMQRPGFQRWPVRRLDLDGRDYALSLVGSEVFYTWPSLVALRVTRIVIDEVNVHLPTSSATSDAEVGATVLGLPAQLEEVWRALPADHVRVARFSTAYEELDVSGELTLSPQALSLRAAALNFTISADVNRAGGVFVHARSGENLLVVRASPELEHGTLEAQWRWDEALAVNGSARFELGPEGWSVGPGLGLSMMQPDLRLGAEVVQLSGGWGAQTEARVDSRIVWQGTLSEGTSRIDGSGQAEFGLSGRSVRGRLVAGSRFVSERLSADELTASGVSLSVRDDIDVLVNLDDESLRVEAARLALDADSVAGWGHGSRASMTIDIGELSADSDALAMKIALDSPQLQLVGRGEVNADLATLAWRTKLDLRQTLKAGLLRHALRPAKLGYDVDSGTIGVELSVTGQGTQSFKGQAAVSLGDLGAHYDEVTLAGIRGTLRLQFTDSDWAMSAGRIAVQRLDVGFLLANLDPQFTGGQEVLELKGVSVEQLKADSDALAMKIALDSPQLQLVGRGEVNADLATLAWRTKLDLRQTLKAGLLRHALRPAKLGYDVDSGTIGVELSVTGQGTQSFKGQAAVSLGDLGAHYDEVTLAGIRGTLRLQFTDSDWVIDEGSLYAREMDVGFPLTELGTQISGGPDAVLLRQARAATLGGQLEVDAMQYELSGAPSEFPLQIKGLQLGALLALEGDTITGEGVLDGRLPVRVEDGAVSVTGGRLSARAPGGVLRYVGATQAAASLDQVGVGFAIAALSDFRFDLLNVGVDYAASGDLLLAIRLEGRNAQFEGGRPIHYNLNVSENIPVLLQSLRLSDEVERRLERRLAK